MSWQSCRLGDVLTLKRGHDLPEHSRQEGDVPVVSSSGITGTHNEARATAPGVVTGRYGTIGEVFYLEKDYWPLNTALYVIDFKGNDPRFAAYFLRNVLKGYQSEKAAVPGVDRNVLHEIRVLVPDLQAQRRIVQILGAYDDLIENNRRRMTLLEESARLLYQEWFVHLRFPGHEHVRITDGLPEGWEKATLESICVSGDGIQTGPFGSQLHQSDYADEGVPVVMPKDLVGFRIATSSIARIPEALADQLSRHRMAVGDTVYGRRGDIGRRAFIGKRQEGWFCGTGCLRLRPDPAAINPLYFFDTLGTPETLGIIANRAKGSTMPNLSAGALKTVPIPVAPRALQDHYAEQVGDIRDMIEVLDEQNQKLRTARDLLLPRLMSGEISV
ncbi:restriction endonuclease subunit S [Zoogloea sp.]|uniref:restriction endonuclease subunit S n=1 Tax=Zoogloea sp. TaxID=49181 RepID=UPI00262D6BE1|nr:restriction endonuclease subunit S [Zoogloea sp.]MDD3352253.1 restriction endonuclease subunit S [Zoogloea sp.]